jgi:tetratricopeptide (TPR) repeat protein
MGDQARALDAVIRALTLNPKAEIYHILKASILDDLGFREEAKEAYRELLEIQPDSHSGHLNLGITLSRSGEMEQAEAEFLRAIEIKPDHPSGYFHIALLCKRFGYDYDERAYLEKFLEVGGKDHRLQKVKERLEELQQYELVVDPEHLYPEIEVMEKMTRVTWKTELHKKAFPDARGYELTFEEDKDVYTTILSMWREKKQEDSEAAYGQYDLLLRIDNAGFLEEYIWYHRQRVFGERATQFMDTHQDRIEAFLDWARTEGLLAEEKPPPASTSRLDRFRGLPADLFEVVEESELLYEIGIETDRPTGLLKDERNRFSRGLKLTGKDRIACGKASRILDEEVQKSGARALLPMFRCFLPGEPGYEHGIRRAASLGLEVREIEFRPTADLILGEKIQLNGESSWLFYALAKAAWRNEPELRERHGGSKDGDRPSIEEEIFALGVAAGAYANVLEPDEPEESAEGSEAAADEDPAAPPEPIPALDRLLEAIEAAHFRGYVL